MAAVSSSAMNPSYMSLAAVACLSAAVGSMATAYMMRRRRDIDVTISENRDRGGTILSEQNNGDSASISDNSIEEDEEQLDDQIRSLVNDNANFSRSNTHPQSVECSQRLISGLSRDEPSINNGNVRIGRGSTSNRRSSGILTENMKRRHSEYINQTERKFKGEEGGFDESVSVAVSALEHQQESDDIIRLLQRTRAVSALGNQLMEAPDEAACIEEVTRLLGVLLGVERVSFGMLTDSKHFLLKRVNIKKKGESENGEGDVSCSSELEVLDSDTQRPLKGTAAGVCMATLKEHYTPNTGESIFATHKVVHLNGFNTVLVTPILVNGNKAAGCIILSRIKEDGFKKSDRVMISDIALLLGANIYSKRLLKEAHESKKRSREMLHSFIPPIVLDKIEQQLVKTPGEYRGGRSSVASIDSSMSDRSTNSSSLNTCGRNNTSNGGGGKLRDRRRQTRSNSWYVAQMSWTEDDLGIKDITNKSPEGIQEKIQFLKDMNRGDDDSDDSNVGVRLTSLPMDLTTTARALYAENVQNVCIVFSDIVGFSKMANHLPPAKVMDLLQNVFSRFDELCDVHNVMKLETIGDAYICATNLLEDHENGIENVKDAAARALAMAKDMIVESENVQMPSLEPGTDPFIFEDKPQRPSLQIRVGIHVGDITCGVLGQRMPKFICCGKAVNMAARMEQTSLPSCIRATKEVYDLIGDAETGWGEKEITPLKNMGEVETYLLNPIECRMNESGMSWLSHWAS